MEKEIIKIDNKDKYKKIPIRKIEKIAIITSIIWIGIFLGAQLDIINEDFMEIFIVELILIICMILSPILIIFVILFSGIENVKFVVTDKRVYGKNWFGKQVDLPLDSISSIGKSCFNGISIATSSGIITFQFLDTREEIYNVISDLLINRQKVNRDINSNSSNHVSISNADELKKYKELLDIGAITEEEYNNKKKELLE